METPEGDDRERLAWKQEREAIIARVAMLEKQVAMLEAAFARAAAEPYARKPPPKEVV